MASWIKWDRGLVFKPEVGSIAQTLGITLDDAAGKCMRFWEWLEDQTIDGNAARVTPILVDATVSCAGFAAALEKAGWATFVSDGISVPNFGRHNGKPAKARALAAERASRFRNASVTRAALPEKRREEKSSASPKKVMRRHAVKNELWDAVCTAFGLSAVTRTEQKRIGKVAAELKQRAVTPAELAGFVKTWKRDWPRQTCSPEAVLKWLDRLRTGSLEESTATESEYARWFKRGGS